MKKWIVGIVIVVVVLGLVVCMSMGKKTPVQSAKAKKSDIRSYVEERARTTLPHTCRITMPQDGRVEPITLKEGDAVKKGQVVASLDDEDWQLAAKEASEMVSAMAAAVTASSSKIKSSQANEEYSKWLLDAKEKLYKNDQTSEMEAKQAKKEYIESQMQYEEDQSDFHVMSAFNAIAKLMPIYVNRRVKRTTIESPLDGIILKRYVQNEKVLQAGEPLLDIGDISGLEVTADILSEEVVAINVGDKVDIFGEVVGSSPISATVKRVKPEGFTKLSSLGVEQQRVGVIISFEKDALAKLEESGRKLGVEYRVRVRVYTDEKKNTTVVPRTALFRGDKGNWKLFAIKNGKAVLTDVEVGLINDKQAEILKGIAVGDSVVIAPESSLDNGDSVQPEA